MHTILNQVLSVNDLDRVRGILDEGSFTDGRATSAVATKRNLQLPIDSPTARDAGTIVLQALARHPVFSLAVHPAAIHRPLFSRYECGMAYPDHIDAAIMGAVRTDVALTIFLSDVDSYDGGELVIDSGLGIRRYRLTAGDAIAYPASTVHHITPVTRGVRQVCVSWVQSLIRHPAQRQILFDLGLLTQNLADTSCGPRLHRSYWNLLRMWADSSPHAGTAAAMTEHDPGT